MHQTDLKSAPLTPLTGHPDVFSFSQKAPDFSQRPLVLMHPFYLWRPSDVEKLDINSTIELEHPEYLSALIRHLTDTQQTVVLFEGKNDHYECLAQTIRRLTNGDLFVVPTLVGDIVTVRDRTTVDGPLHFLSLFQEQGADFAGGRYNSTNLPDGGCLESLVDLYADRTHKQVNVIEGLTFE